MAVILFLGGGWFFLFGKNNDNGDNFLHYTSKNGLAAGIKSEEQKDSDNDGLKDWEEALWKTDPQNPDSDGDGTPDGEEVAEGRNPAVPGPNDKIAKNPAKQAVSEKRGDIGNIGNIKDIGEMGKTGVFAQKFIPLFVSLKKSGQLNEQTKEKIDELFLKKLKERNLPDKYSLSDLNIYKKASKEDFKIYGNSVARVMEKYGGSGGENEITIIKRALKNKSQSDLNNLEPIATIYRESARELLLIRVPVKIVIYHLEMINSFSNLSEILKEISLILKDPIVGIGGMMQYSKEYFKVRASVYGMSDFFSKNGIFFNKNDDGYFFTEMKQAG